MLDLYHTALEVTLPEGRFVIENCWPIPNAEGPARGVTVEGPVWSPHLGRLSMFRYEVRRWVDGYIADAAEAVDSPQCVSRDQAEARRVLELTHSVPAHVWGRDLLGSGDMWNSNSVIAWLLASGGLAVAEMEPPPNGRAPGWETGIAIAKKSFHQGIARGDGPCLTMNDPVNEQRAAMPAFLQAVANRTIGSVLPVHEGLGTR